MYIDKIAVKKNILIFGNIFRKGTMKTVVQILKIVKVQKNHFLLVQWSKITNTLVTLCYSKDSTYIHTYEYTFMFGKGLRTKYANFKKPLFVKAAVSKSRFGGLEFFN